MQLDDSGFRFVLSPRLPGLVREHVRETVTAFLSSCDVSLRDVGFWVVHPGGPKILQAVGEGLGLDEGALQPSWRVWSRCGNVSSATVFFILREIAASATPPPGALGVMLAFGPGLTCEMALLRADGWLARRDYS
jgi:alkylresorcinol/alkylpyrone synthase